MKITTNQLRQLIKEIHDDIVQDGVGIGADPLVRRCLEAYDQLTFEQRQYVLKIIQNDVDNG